MCSDGFETNEVTRVPDPESNSLILLFRNDVSAVAISQEVARMRQNHSLDRTARSTHFTAEKMAFSVGEKLTSYQDFALKLDTYQNDKFVQFNVRNSRTVEAAKDNL